MPPAVTIEPTCPSGQHFDSALNKCVPDRLTNEEILARAKKRQKERSGAAKLGDIFAGRESPEDIRARHKEPTPPQLEPIPEPITEPTQEPTQEPAEFEQQGVEFIKDQDTGKISGIRFPDGRTILGLSPDEARELSGKFARETTPPAGTTPLGTAQSQAEETRRKIILAKSIGTIDF
ncbi:hypothetical protein LCGC14_2804510, partial [marine sediment metagenome]